MCRTCCQSSWSSISKRSQCDDGSAVFVAFLWDTLKQNDGLKPNYAGNCKFWPLQLPICDLLGEKVSRGFESSWGSWGKENIRELSNLLISIDSYWFHVISTPMSRPKLRSTGPVGFGAISCSSLPGTSGTRWWPRWPILVRFGPRSRDADGMIHAWSCSNDHTHRIHVWYIC